MERVRSERAQQIRKKAFERALEDGKWDWIAAHLAEIEGDAELKAKIVERANAQGMHALVRFAVHLKGAAGQLARPREQNGGVALPHSRVGLPKHFFARCIFTGTGALLSPE